MRRSLVVFALGLGGCGHPATTEECEAIFRRSAEIELEAQGVRDPAEVDRRIEEARAAKGDELLKKCIGQRITERSMKCVRGAKTAEDIEKCLK